MFDSLTLHLSCYTHNGDASTQVISLLPKYRKEIYRGVILPQECAGLANASKTFNIKGTTLRLYTVTNALKVPVGIFIQDLTLDLLSVCKKLLCYLHVCTSSVIVRREHINTRGQGCMRVWYIWNVMWGLIARWVE